MQYESLEARNLLAADLGILNHLAVSDATSYLQEGASDLNLVQVQSDDTGTTTLFQQTVDGLPVHGAYVSVVQNTNGAIENVFDRGYENMRTHRLIGPSIGLNVAEQLASEDIDGRLLNLTSGEQVWFFAGNRARLAWQVDAAVGSEDSHSSYSTIVDAYSGAILNQEETGVRIDEILANPELDSGLYPRIVINDTVGPAGSRAYAAPFDAVASLDLGCTGTLIAPNVVISARHCGASPGDTITFGDNSNNGIYTATVQSVSLPDGNGSLLDGGDVSILTLTANVPSNVATPMRFIDATTSLVGMTAATIGYGYNGVGSSGHGFSADGWRWGGENIIDVYGSPAGASGSNIISTDFDNGTSGANTISGSSATPIANEATTAPGDSGGPVLVQSNGEWLIAGVLSGGTTNTSVYGDISWWTGTAIYKSQIEAAGGVFTTGGGGQLGTVSLDQASYFADGTVNVTVNDSNGITPISVTLTSDSGDSESLTLSGGGPYTGAISLSESGVSTNDGTLQVSVGDSITVSYTDPDDGNGGSGTVNDTATIIQQGSGGVISGVDFDAAGGPAPTNWLNVDGGSNATFANLAGEDGSGTLFDLNVVETVDGTWDDFAVTPITSTIPQHTNNLASIDGQIYTGGDPLALTYSDLTPGADYEIYVMSAEGFYSSISQRVTINGGGSPVVFDQVFNTDQLFINDQLGDNTRSLAEYAQIITADNNGQISIDIAPINNTQDVVLAGIAIAEVAATSTFETVGTAGTITNLNHTWRTINLPETFVDPVVVFGPLSNNGDDPSVVRVRNVTGNSFDVRLQEYAYLNQTHINETVGYVVLEAGTHTLEDGTKVVAGNVNLDDDVFSSVNFGSAFSGTPVVMSQTATFNGSSAVTTRHQNVSPSGFEVRMQEAQADNQIHVQETVSWIAIGQSNGSSNGSLFEAGVTGDLVTHNDFSENFASAFASAPVFLASMQTFDGPDNAYVRYRTLDANGATFYIDEERSADNETNHTTENVGYFAFESGAIYALGSGGRSITPPGQVTEASSQRFDLYFGSDYDEDELEFGSLFDELELA